MWIPNEKKSFVRDHIRNLFIIALTALLFRLAYFYEYRHSPYYGVPIVDSLFFSQQAEMIAAGDTLGVEPYQKAPLYSYLIALITFLTGKKFFFLILFQIMLSMFNCLIAYRISTRFMSRNTSLGLGLFMAVYIPEIFYTCEILRPVLLNFLMLMFIEFLLLAQEQKSRTAFAAAGIMAGLTAITKATGLLMAALGACWILSEKWSSIPAKSFRLKISFAVVFILSAGCIILPVTLRNFALSNDIVLISSNGGLNFFTGNNRFSDGTSAIQPGILWNRVMKQQHSMPHFSAASISRAWWEKGCYFIIQNPAESFKLFLKKLLLFINDLELRNNRDIDFSKDYSMVLRFPSPGFGMLVMFSLPGMGIALKEFRRFKPLYLVPAMILAVNLIFFTCSRYRIGIVPFLAIFAFYFIEYLIQQYRRKKFFNLLSASFFILLLYLFTHQNIWPVQSKNFSRDYFYLGNIYAYKKDFRSALKCYFKAAELAPEDPDPCLASGVVCEKTGDTRNACIAYRKTLSLAPDSIDALVNLSSLLIRSGKTVEAGKLITGLKHHNPDHPLLHFNLASCLDLLGKHNKALYEYRHSLNLGGPKAAIYNNIGYIFLKYRARIPDAVKLIEKAVRMEPDNPMFLDSLGLGYFLMDDYPQSVRVLKKAMKGSSNNPTILFHLAQSQFKLGNHKEAILLGKVIQKFHPGAKEAERAGLLLKEIKSREADRGEESGK